MVLAFHKVEPRLTWGVTNYSPDQFAKLLDFIADLKLSDNDVSIELTFDDGYKSFLDHADGMLTERNLTATIFALSGYLGKRNTWDYSSILAPSPHMNAEELRIAASHGHKIQSHTHTHRDLRSLSKTELHTELADSKAILEDILGAEVSEICYPFGLYNDRVEEVAREVGYAKGWSMNPTDSGPFTFGRWGIYAYDTPLTLWAKLNPDSFGAKLEILKLRTTSLMARAGRFAFWTE